MILSGMRIGLARAWRAGVGAEAFAGIRWGLSAGIFDAQEYLDIAFMMVALGILGLFGFVLEKVLFQPIESRTVIRWGMMEAMGAQDKKGVIRSQIQIFTKPGAARVTRPVFCVS